MLALLHRVFPRLHRWQVIYTDDEECRCGRIRLWPGGQQIDANGWSR